MFIIFASLISRMGIAERKEREKEGMRKRIMDAAFEMFLKEGYTGTSLRLIAKKIEYSPATIYLYYKDKDALFFDIQTRCFDILIAKYKKIEHLPAFERLQQIGYVYMDHHIQNPQCFNLVFLLDSPLSEFKRQNRWDKYGNAIGFFKYTVAECMENKLINYTDEMEACLEIWGQAHGLITLVVKRSYEGLGLNEKQAHKLMKTTWANFLNRIRT